MPTVSIYIRKDDYSKYLSIENPSEFIHNALNPDKVFIVDKAKVGTPETSIRPINVKENSSTFSAVGDFKFPINNSIPNKPKLCKHNNPKGSCMHKESHRLKCNV